MSERNPIYRSWNLLQSKTLTAASVTVTIGDTMKETLIEAFDEGRHPEILVIPNWAPPQAFEPPNEQQLRQERALLGLQNKKVISITGNLGVTHGIDRVADIAYVLQDEEDLVFLVISEGVGADALRARIAHLNLSNVRVLPPQPWDKFVTYLHLTDIALIAQKPGTEHLSMPSRTYTCLAAGNALFAISSAESDLARLITENGVGIAPGTRSPEILASALRDFTADEARLGQAQERARKLAITQFSHEAVRPQLLEAMKHGCDGSTERGGEPVPRFGEHFLANSRERWLSRIVADTPNGLSVDHLHDGTLIELATRNEVLPHLVHKALDNDLEVPADLIQAHAKSEARMSAYMNELDRISGAFNDQNITVVALKNAGIARGLYPCSACCPMGDVDVLVSKASFRKAHEVLLGLGYDLEFRSPYEEDNIERAEQAGGSEYRTTLSEGLQMWLELQWRPVAGRWIAPHMEPEADELLERSVEMEGSPARLLAPEDNLLQVAVHTAKHSFVRAPGFRLHTNVDRLVRRTDVDWERFLHNVEQLHLRVPVFFALYIPRTVFETPIPNHVLAALKPAGWRTRVITRLIEQAGLFASPEKKFSRPSYLLLTALMFDSFVDLFRAAFPRPASMRTIYEHSTESLVRLYARRLIDLLSPRSDT